MDPSTKPWGGRVLGICLVFAGAFKVGLMGLLGTSILLVGLALMAIGGNLVLAGVFAEEVRFTGTLRTYDEAFRDSVVEMMRQILDGITAAHGASRTFEFRKGYPSVINDPDLVAATLPTLRRLFGETNVIESTPGHGRRGFFLFREGQPRLLLPARGLERGQGYHRVDPYPRLRGR